MPGDTGLPPTTPLPGPSGGSDDDGGSDGPTANPVVTVNNEPSAVFTYWPQDPVVGDEITFDASGSYDPDGSINRYEWDFGSDDEVNQMGKRVTHVFERAGRYEVQLRVIDDRKKTATATTQIQIAKLEAPKLDVEARPVQIVDNTVLPGAASVDVTPRLVANETTTVLFEIITGEDAIRALPNEDTVEIAVDREIDGEVSLKTVHVETSTVEEIAKEGFLNHVTGNGESLANLVTDDETYPVFAAEKDLESITVSVNPPGDVESGKHSLRAGVDFKLDSLPSLNLGFVAFEGFTSGTDEQSGPDSYEETVETAIEYVQRVFPTTRVNAYRHDVRVAGEWIPGDPSGETPGEFLFDLLGTHIELQSMLAEHGKVVA